MQKYIEINWLQDINIIQCTAYNYPYISAPNSLINSCHLLLEYISFIKNLLLQNNKLSVSIVKNYIRY